MLYKIYTKNNVYKWVIEWGIIGSDFNFSVQSNWWQGVLRISLKKDYSDNSIIYGDIIKAFDDYWILKYTGFVNTIYRKYTPDYNYIEYECVWLASLLSQVIYKDWWDYQKVLTIEPNTLINSVLSLVNGKHPVIASTWSIKTLGTTIQIEIKGNNCREVLDSIADITGWSWYIWQDGVLIFGDDSYYTEHKLTLWWNIESMEISDDWNWLYNTTVVQTTDISYNSEGNEIRTPIYTEYTNSGSISTYWRRERVIRYDNITDVWTGGVLASNLLDENKEPVQKITLECSIFDSIIQSIIPWDRVNIRNSDYILQWLLVSQIRYSTKRVTIEIKTLENYTKLLVKNTL